MQPKTALFTDAAFETQVDKIDAGSIKDLSAFGRLLVTPGAPASVKASFLHARLSPHSSLTAGTSNRTVASAAEYAATLTMVRGYGPPRIDEIIEMMHQFLSDRKTQPALVTKPTQVARFITLCAWRFQCLPERTRQAHGRYREALAQLLVEEFTLRFTTQPVAAQDAGTAGSASGSSDSDDDDSDEDAGAFGKMVCWECVCVCVCVCVCLLW
jgi:hypothetical protein